MPKYTNYEEVLSEPDRTISPPRMINLQRIIQTFPNDSATMSLQQIGKALNLQSFQLKDAICQVGMRRLFNGEQLQFRLSNYGRQVYRGELLLNSWGVEWSKAKKAADINPSELLQPLTWDEIKKLKNAKDITNLGTDFYDLAVKLGIDNNELTRRAMLKIVQNMVNILSKPAVASNQPSERIKPA